MSELDLEKLKISTQIVYARYNPNHGKDGRFTFSSGGKDSGGGTGYGRSVSGSTFKKADENTQLDHQKAIAKLSGSEYDVGTYDLNTMKQIDYDDGYQVTFCQIGDDYSNSEYANKVNEFLAETTDGRTSAGKFENTPEVSFHVNSREKAISLAKKYNQISVWDWSAGDEIKTGGTGRRK